MRMTESEPGSPVAAVVHDDPYPYYARLRREKPLYFDEGLGVWVASTASVVQAALSDPALHVRPPGEPVPRALVGTPAGEVFAHLVRMNDGDFHTRHKPTVQQATSRFGLAQVAQAARDAAHDLAPRLDANALLSALPVQAMARLLGVPAELRDRTARWVDEFVQGIAGQASSEAVARASKAAQELMAQGEAQGLNAVRSANRIALMQQSLDATAGLLGNTIRALRTRPELIGPKAQPEAWRAFVAEVGRWDSSVQNTRRFASADLVLTGRRITQGQGLLLVLASANRDESLNPNPDAFEVARHDRRSMSFGFGTHGCPGEAIAIQIAAASVAALQEMNVLDSLFGPCVGFRPLPNARIPVFETGAER
jgi:cytochrome P450